MQKHAHPCTNIQRSNDIDESNEGLKRVVRTSFMTRELHTKASMTRIKTVSVVLCAFAALCGCWPQENPDRIYTIVLDSGNSQRALKIPIGFIEEKSEKFRAIDGIALGFIYPSMNPYVIKAPTKDSVSVYIRLISDPTKMSMSELSLATIKKKLMNSTNSNSVRFIGKSSVYDIYEDIDTQTHSITTTYFTRDKNGILIEFRYSQGHLSLARRRFAEVFEVSYGYSPTLQSKQLKIDAAVTGLIETWLQK